MVKSKLHPHILFHQTPGFQVRTLQIESLVLHKNPLNDSPERFIPVLSPTQAGPHPVAFVLAGFTGNAPFYLNAKFNEQNAVQVITENAAQGLAPRAHYVFVDTLTSWGGSQFLNSEGTGRYEDFVIQELVPLVQASFECAQDPQEWCLMGGSSGGYGALHLGSKFPQIFGCIAAIAPDSFFNISLLPEYYNIYPAWEKYQSSGNILKELRAGKITKLKNWHSVLNAMGMAACYAPKTSTQGPVDIYYPIDKKGQLIPEVWSQFLEKDPLHFLPQRLSQLKSSQIFLDVGNKDNFNLHFGARQITELLTKAGVTHHYSEFDGNHFDISSRRTEVWKWLAQIWRQ